MAQTTALQKVPEGFILLNPLINGLEDLIEVREAQRKNLLFCPECYLNEGVLIPFRFRNYDDRVKHFAHYDPNAGYSRCSGSNPESQKHLNAKRAVFDDLQAREGVADVKYEFSLIKNGVRQRRPDAVALYPNGATVAVEIQISRIYPEQLLQRIEDAKLHGIGSIEWYLYDKNYSIENRKICFNLGAKCFRLWFDGDDTKPRWEPDTEIGAIVAEERARAKKAEEEKKKRLEQEVLLEQKRKEERRQAEEFASRWGQRLEEDRTAIKKILAPYAGSIAGQKRREEPSAAIPLIDWYLSLPTYPSTPFVIAPWLTAQDGYFEKLREECQRAKVKKTPRVISGGLQSELDLLKKAIDLAAVSY